MTARGPDWLDDIPRPIRSGHRGAAGLVAANTLASYAEAVRLGCDLVEVDVQPTADGVLILHHDREVLVEDVRRPIASLTLGELRAHAAEDVPTLAEALALLRQRAVPLLDLKGIGFERQLGAEVRRAGVRRAIVCGNPLASLLATNQANPDIATSLTLDGRELAAIDPAAISAVPTHAVTVNYRRLTAALIGLFHDQGLTVIAWTVDEPAVMQDLVANGVDGITTNRPDLLIARFPRQ
jgi:glycerophosphoryl diester phosphodiesterase